MGNLGSMYAIDTSYSFCKISTAKTEDFVFKW